MAAVVLASCSRLETGTAPALPQRETGDFYSVSYAWRKIQPLAALPPIPGESAVTAGFGESRTSLEISGEGSVARVLWTAGDSFTMYGHYDSGYVHSVYTALSGGASADFSSAYTVPFPAHCLYPAATKVGGYAGSDVFGVEIPPVQRAIAGNIADDLNLSYAYCKGENEDIHFENLLALVKFRMEGKATEEVEYLTLAGSGALSGDAIVMTDGNGNAYLTDNISFQGDESYPSVTLEGPFTEGEDYYLAVIPCSGVISMSFYNADGERITKNSSAVINFTQGRICDIGTVDIGDDFSQDEDMSPVAYLESPLDNPVTLAVIPEGFTQDELQEYELAAKSGLAALFATEPYKSYKDHFNVWILKVASKESGAGVTDGDGNLTESRDTYFKAQWGENSYSDMTADDNTVFSFVSNNCPDITDGTHNISEVPVLMIINDARYGGICWSYSSGKGYAMVPLTEGNFSWNYPASCAVSDEDPSAGTRSVTEEERAELGQNIGDWRNTLVHEFGGHCFGRLGDEYWYSADSGPATSISTHSWTVPMGLNLSASYSVTPWDELLSERDALAAANPLYARIGVYQGGGVSILNRWRSEKTSCMIDNRFYFSAWQRMLIVKRIKSLCSEKFSTQDFFSRDVPEDPVRDIAPGGAPYGLENLPAALKPQPVPPLPPVRLVVDD